MAARWSEAELPLFAEAKRSNDPERALEELAAEARGCRRCPLYRNATQTVFGEGPADAHLMLVGEQPGDQEDLAGRPFVGPAGKVLDSALERAGIERDSVYITNAVKHFKNEPRGKRRIHKKPDTARSTPAAGGSTRNLPSSGPMSWSRLARRRRARSCTSPSPSIRAEA
jgi:DNA polymerase